MGPPVFAPLLFGTAAYLGLIASFLRRERVGWSSCFGRGTGPDDEYTRSSKNSRGAFQQHMLLATALSAALSGSEAWYSHDKSHFRYAASGCR